LTGAPDCTPGYDNNEGQAPTPIQRLAVGYPAGASAYFRYLDAWRATGDFTGLEFR
jgi:cyclohexanone monooxygenase